MNLRIGSVIQKLRKLKGLTQEQLAESIGVSKAAVSKWESGSTYPDITLLSPIARLLDTTVDGLLEFEENLTKNEIDEILMKCSNKFTTSDYFQAYEYSEKYLKEYPNCLELKLQMTGLYFIYMSSLTSEGDMNRFMDRIIEMLKEVSKSEDNVLKDNALLSLSSYYIMLEKYDEALAVVNKLPESSTDRKVVTATIYYHNGDIGASKSIYQQLLLESIQNCGINLVSLAKIAEKEGNLDKGIKILGTNMNISKLFNVSNNGAGTYMEIAEMYARNGMEEKALDALEKYELFVINSLGENKENLSDTIYFDTIKVEKKLVTNEHMKDSINLLFEGNESFDAIKDNIRFKKLIKRIKELN
ncbi:helix-turn-helix domain-containing protein [Clostridium sp.]|uniref:helix-turn-helix domain-containing protein n=1 Tax=Clostridium sp. TaxID=1506 RepID=UPI002908B80A|nr:helix-turn-helix domain-containing protein [Clostridium sp.]MDU3323694.1 helix-turn-helix domain-containing protein [Escherichia coli]MDU3411863.1 helix-turn-helix domain-containing protein [Clostridium sp.]